MFFFPTNPILANIFSRSGLDFENFKKCLNNCWDDFEDKAKNSDSYNEQLVKDFENCVSSGCKAD